MSGFVVFYIIPIDTVQNDYQYEIVRIRYGILKIKIMLN